MRCYAVTLCARTRAAALTRTRTARSELVLDLTALTVSETAEVAKQAKEEARLFAEAHRSDLRGAVEEVRKDNSRLVSTILEAEGRQGGQMTQCMEKTQAQMSTTLTALQARSPSRATRALYQRG